MIRHCLFLSSCFVPSTKTLSSDVTEMLPKRLDATNRREFLLGLSYGIISFAFLGTIYKLPEPMPPT